MQKKNNKTTNKYKFLLPFIVFFMVSFMVFAPTTNILFSLPKETRATELVSDGLSYGVATVVCYALQSLGGLKWSTASILGVPSADLTVGTSAEQMFQLCVAAWGFKIHDIIVETLTYAATETMNQLLMDITNKIITCINSYDTNTGKCTGGDSLLVLDFNSLLQDATDIAGAKFLNSLTTINLCQITPAVNLQLALLPIPEFKERAVCTLSTIVSNIDDFYNDFTKGGWIAYKESLKPNNNAFGLWLMTTNKKISDEYDAATKAEKEAPNGFKSAKKCIASTDETNHPLSGLNADSEYCAATQVITPSGTIETSVNFAALSPIRTMESKIAGLYSKMGPFGIYATAITNALFNKLTSTGVSALLSEISSSDVAGSDPYQDVIDSVAATTTDYATAQANQAYASAMISTLTSTDSFITDTAKPTYSDIIAVLTDIQTEENKIINDYWAQGIIDSGTTYPITSGPTTTAIGGTTTTTTTYSVSEPTVGSATIQKQEILYAAGTTTTIYSINSIIDQIEGADGLITSYTDKYNSVAQTQAQIPGAQTQTQTAYNDITSYVSSWTGTSSDDANELTMNTTIANTISYFQNSANWAPASTSTTLEGIYTDITSAYDTIYADANSEIINLTESTYDTYLTDVQTIYTNLGSSTTRL